MAEFQGVAHQCYNTLPKIHILYPSIAMAKINQVSSFKKKSIPTLTLPLLIRGNFRGVFVFLSGLCERGVDCL